MSMQRFDLADRVALVTGGGSGIGRGIALALASAGAEVVVLGRRPAPLEESCRLIRDAGGRAWALEADIAEPAQSRAAIERIVDARGRLDILVNAAGTQLRSPAIEIDEAGWDRLMSVNLRGLFFCCQAAARIMRARGGRIINITSLTAVIGLPLLAAYGASKGGVSQLTAALAVEWAPLGITVNAIGPGRIRTPMTEPLFADPELRTSFERLIPLGQAGTPDDLGGAALLLASDAGRYITGQTLYIDGGWLAAGGAPLR